MPACSIRPTDQKLLGKKIGEDLGNHYGKKRYYSRTEVESALQREAFPMDWSCWAFCLYLSPGDFDSYHSSIGETCNYALMKGEMVSALTDGASDSWFDWDLSWLDWPDIDLSAIFDFDFDFFD